MPKLTPEREVTEKYKKEFRRRRKEIREEEPVGIATISRLMNDVKRLKDKVERYAEKIPELEDIAILLDDILGMLKDIAMWYS